MPSLTWASIYKIHHMDKLKERRPHPGPSYGKGNLGFSLSQKLEKRLLNVARIAGLEPIDLLVEMVEDQLPKLEMREMLRLQKARKERLAA